jgi:hypothetical protein
MVQSVERNLLFLPLAKEESVKANSSHYLLSLFVFFPRVLEEQTRAGFKILPD